MLDHETATRFLTALGDPARLDLLLLLGDKGRLNVGNIAKNFRLSRPAISHHLKVLKDAHIVRSEKQGQEVYYWLDQAPVVAMLRELADIVEHCSPVEPSE